MLNACLGQLSVQTKIKNKIKQTFDISIGAASALGLGFSLGLAMMATTVSAVASEALPVQSQTLVRRSNGDFLVLLPEAKAFKDIRQNVDLESAAYLYEKKTPLAPLEAIGGNYAFLKNGMLITVSYDGVLYSRGKFATPSVMGGVYFVDSSTGKLVTIDSSGLFNRTVVIPNNIRLVGGNFYIDGNNVLTTIKHQGVAPGDSAGQVVVKEGWTFPSAKMAGGNFFINEHQEGSQSAQSVSSVTGNFNAPYALSSKVVKVGGNYFITEQMQLYTVNYEGVIQQVAQLQELPSQLGYSYMIFRNGSFMMIDATGATHSQAVVVSPTGVYRNIVLNFPVELLQKVPTFLGGK